MIEKYPFYTKYHILAGTYKGVDADVQTVAVVASFIVSDDLSEDLVYKMTRALFEHADEITIGHPKGAELDPEYSVESISIPMHPGAEKYYKEIGVLQLMPKKWLPAGTAIVVTITVSVFLFFTLSTPCLILKDGKTGEMIAAFPADDGTEFSVTFIHSVNQTPVTDVYQIKTAGST